MGRKISGPEDSRSADGLFEFAMRTTASDVLAYLDLTHDRWAGGRLSSWVFRGVSSERYDLRPSAWRPKVIKDRAWRPQRVLARAYANEWVREHSVDEFKGFGDLRKSLPEGTAKKKLKHLVTLIEQIRWEQLLHRRFVQLADELGFDVAGEFAKEHNVESPPFTDKLVTPYPKQSAAFAQHHHIPTRLLDWTRSPLKALFFALEKNMVRPAAKGNFAIWALNVRYLACLERVYRGKYDQWDKLGMFHMYAKRAGHGFLLAQDGLFTWIHGWEKPYLRTLQFPDVQSALQALHSVGANTECGRQFSDEPILRQVVAPVHLAADLLKMLELHQVTKCRLMPSLDNIAETLRMEAILPAHTGWIPEAHPMKLQSLIEFLNR